MADMINRIVDQLIIDEGIRLKPYYCPANKLTIGIGRNLEGNGLSWDEMITLIQSYNPYNEKRKQRFPADYLRQDGAVLMEALIKDFNKWGITRDEAIYLCKNDIYNCINQLNKKLKWFESSPEELKEVLINMCFNMGIKSLLTFRNTLYHMSVGQYKKASVNMLKSKWARQVKGRAVRLAERVKKLEEE